MILNQLNLPQQIKDLSFEQLNLLAKDTREKIIEVVCSNGGHLAASLGAVELTIALLSVFDPLEDIILFDVGHQSYAYKILTDRREGFDSLRQYGGISGFPRPNESVYDKFSAGHAGNALAAACGYSRARELSEKYNHIISVLGDGVLANGLTLESFNNATSSGKQIIIINDNNYSISQSVGSITEYLNTLGTKQDMLQQKNSPFAMYGIDYLGKIDGHNIKELISAFKTAKNHPRSIIIHTITTKGKGYKVAEQNPTNYHAVGNGKCKSMGDKMGQTLCKMAKQDKNIVAITAAMGVGTGLKSFQDSFADRYFDVGIAEGHAITMAAAMAKAGYKPYVAIYSTFLQRAYDQVINDVCLQELPVTFCIDRSGLVGEDGETHHGLFDLNFLLSIPNLTVSSPATHEELANILQWSKDYTKPLAIRYPRGSFDTDLGGDKDFPNWSYVVSNNSEIVLIATGALMVKQAQFAADFLTKWGINIDVINARFNKPLDTALLDIIYSKKLFVLEDTQKIGGFASYIGQHFKDKYIFSKSICDTFVTHGSIQSLLKHYELDGLSVAKWIKTNLNN